MGRRIRVHGEARQLAAVGAHGVDLAIAVSEDDLELVVVIEVDADHSAAAWGTPIARLAPTRTATDTRVKLCIGAPDTAGLLARGAAMRVSRPTASQQRAKWWVGARSR